MDLNDRFWPNPVGNRLVATDLSQASLTGLAEARHLAGVRAIAPAGHAAPRSPASMRTVELGATAPPPPHPARDAVASGQPHRPTETLPKPPTPHKKHARADSQPRDT